MSDPSDPHIPIRRQAVPLRDPRYAPRPRGPRINASHLLVVTLFCVFIIGAAAFMVMALSPQGSPRPAAGSQVANASGSARPEATSALGSGGQGPVDPGASPGGPGSSQTPDASPSPGPAGGLAMPIVPVVSFWSTDEGISLNELKKALQAQSSAYPHVIVRSEDRASIGTALGISVAGAVESGDVDQIRLKTRAGYLGLLPASALTARVRALSLEGASLVGEGHLKKLADWPLMATVQAPVSDRWDPGATWTMVAGGDMFLDRGVRNTTLEMGKGIDYPFAGGTAKVTGHCTCSPSKQIPNELVPVVQRTGNAGIVRNLVMHADLAIANLENPIPDNPSWHLSGTIFGGPAKLLPMFTNAGIDWVSLANNHIFDYGAAGVAQTRQNLKRAGIPFSGAGANLEQAGQIAYLQTKGLKVGLVACVLVPGVHLDATPTRSGPMGCDVRYTLPRITEARANADLVIVFAHWGNEYHREPFPSQIKLAQQWVAAGADIILGGHPHVFGGLQEINGKPAVYSMGNFIFDQYWSTPTMESALTEITLQGTRVVQIRLHPYVILDQAQPNFLDPARDDGRQLLKEVRAVSDGLGW